MNARDILEYYQVRIDPILNSIREVVDIESPSHNAAGSRAVADWVVRQALLTGADISIERVSVDDGDHVIIRAFTSDEAPALLLGHTDTVHPVGASKQNPTRVDGDKFYGCGIFDMKANVALMLEALRFFAEPAKTPTRPLVLLLSCDEEVGSFTGRALVEREAGVSKRCLVLEPSASGKIKTGRKGTGMYTLRTHGVPAHAGLEPENGANAIAELARQVEPIHSIADPDLGTTVNVCTIKGGTATNVIPEFAEISIDARFTKMNEGWRVDAAVRELTPFDPRVSIELSGGINRPPLERTDAVVELYERARRIALEFDYDVGETQVGGASDGNFVGGLGVPVLDGLGVNGAGAHTLDEYILISDVARRATLITLLLAMD